MRTIAIIQARMSSSRLPGKVMLPLGEERVIQHVHRRVSMAKSIDEVVIATTNNLADNKLAEYCAERGYLIFRGSESDVLSRYFECAREHGAEIVARITADCPFIDPNLIDEAVSFRSEGGYDYASNTLTPTFPDGLDVEVFTFDALQQANNGAHHQYEREHVTPFIKTGKDLNIASISNQEDLSKIRWTLDEAADYRFFRTFFELGISGVESWKELLQVMKKNWNQLDVRNQSIERDEGSKMGRGQKLYKRAKDVIPGGTMLLSKRPEMFLPDFWPAYFESATGCTVTDLDGKSYVDMSIMGIGTNSLGYGDKVVDGAVAETIRKGNMSTLNCPEEVLLVERLTAMHPWSSMGKLTRSGGEANAVALRIARAFSGKSKVAICGYHGWHDWYLSANIASKDGLGTHLLPGLSTAGVPSSLAGETLPFYYNDIESLKFLFETNDNIGAIFMEVQRNQPPEKNFLQKVRALANENGAVLIFDECTSGFRETFGGLHLKYGVNPDLAMFGKALGNGYAINAIIGTREVMQSAQDTFISSTFWTERIGPTAALAALDRIEQERSWEVISKTGRKVKDIWQSLADEFNLRIEILGLDSLASFVFVGEHSLIYKTYLTQEMLKRGYLASTIFYASLAHTNKIIEGYSMHLREVFSRIADVERGIVGVEKILAGDICHQGFKRLN